MLGGPMSVEVHTQELLHAEEKERSARAKLFRCERTHPWDHRMVRHAAMKWHRTRVRLEVLQFRFALKNTEAEAWHLKMLLEESDEASRYERLLTDGP